MSISSIFGSPILLLPPKSITPQPPRIGCGGLLIECSSRPQKKATAHHMKTRPRKTQPWDVRRKPTVYPPLPPLPPDWTLLSSDDADADSTSATEAALPSAAPLPSPITTG